MHLCRSSSNVPRLPSLLEMLQDPHVLLTFDKVHNPLRLPREMTSEPPKVLRTPQFFALLTSTCASRHNGMHFFDSSTSKSAPNVQCFSFLTCKCASRHNGVQFSISHLASWLRTRRFSEPTFRPPRAINHWKTQCFATFLPFRAPGSSFFFLLSPFFFSSFFFSSSFYLLPSSFFSSLPSSLLFLLLFSSFFSSLLFLLLSSPLLSSALLFSSLLVSSLLFSSLFSSLLFSDSSHVCSSSVHIVGSLTSKFPSISTLAGFYPDPTSEGSYPPGPLKGNRFQGSDPLMLSLEGWAFFILLVVWYLFIFRRLSPLSS